MINNNKESSFKYCISKSMCFGCGSCASKCPYQAITMERNELGFLYPKLDSSKCVNCGLCSKSCPAVEHHFIKNNEIKEAFCISSKHSQESASGGVFYELALNFINSGGYIAGTVWNNDFIPEIIISNSISDVNKMRGSKYVNGGTGFSYKTTEDLLKKNKKVLFSGTPCQIAGLYKFLGKDYDNLTTIEILCHGGGSPLAWKKYLDFTNKKYGKNIIDYKMQKTKNKITLYFEDNTKIIEDINNENKYVPIYMHGKITRDCCKSCPYMGRIRNGDIIIGDIWAKWAAKYRNNGISLFIPNSEKGKKALKENTWNICNEFDINSSENDPLNKINNNIPIPNIDNYSIKNKIKADLSWEDIIEDKKVALMNFNYPRDNYGALLLAYAMEKVVRDLGYEPYTINYYKNPITMDFDIQGATWKFREKYLNLYGFATEKWPLYQYNGYFHKFIFGSDIIWNQNREYVYYADWCIGNHTLIAYAASFGENKLIEPDDYKKECFKRFDRISVRELSGIKLLKDFAEIDSEWVIDPTLLLNKEDYQKIIDDENCQTPENEYIAYYTFWKFNPYNVKINLPIYNLFKDDYNRTRSFAEWLSLIKNSKGIITASFHGVCFSLLYNKPFVYIKKPNEDNERVISLFRKFNININRIVESEKDVTASIMFSKIDWDNINNTIKDFKEYSQNWLKDALNCKANFKPEIKISTHEVINFCGAKIKIRKNENSMTYKLIKKIKDKG